MNSTLGLLQRGHLTTGNQLKESHGVIDANIPDRLYMFSSDGHREF